MGGWLVTTAPSALPHVCEEVILILSGAGKYSVACESFAFGPNSTMILKSPAVALYYTNPFFDRIEIV